MTPVNIKSNSALETIIRIRAEKLATTFNPEQVASVMKVDLTKIFRKTRKREIVEKRQSFMALMYRETRNNGTSLADVGKFCGGKDHATVLHAIRTVQNLIDTKKDFREEWNRVNLTLGYKTSVR
jgi:chromosomal replication initiator protein